MPTRPTAAPLIALLLPLAGVPAGAADIPVDLALVVAVDVSGSIDEEEAQLQRQGYVDAFQNPRIARAIRSGPYGRIAVTYVEWAGDHYQRTVVGWTILDTPGAPRSFADTLALAPVGRERWTSISAALAYCGPLFEQGGFDATRKVIDLSGDGPNNNGPLLEPARQATLARGITINGLPIVNDHPNPWGGEAPRDLEGYYRTQVIGGPGAFVVAARTFDAFSQAVLDKLLLEIAGRTPDRDVAACPGCPGAP